MRNISRKFIVVAACLTAVAWLAACSGLDDGDSADVVLQVGTISSVPINATPDTADPTQCAFTTITPWTMTLQNRPKNSTAIESPFNDIVLESMTIAYTWSNPAFTTPTTTFPIGGTVPANGTFQLQFFPIALAQLTGEMGGESAAMTMAIRGRTNSGAGDVVTANAGATLALSDCQLQPVTGACCGGGTCQLLTPTECLGGGGLYLGDGTTCALDPCGAAAGQ